MDKVLFSSESTEWETPQDLFDGLNQEHQFNLDVCATKENAKCRRFFTIEDDGLSQDWVGRVWCNPPYGRGVIDNWVSKAVEEIRKGNAEIVVMLLPARTCTKWFHECVVHVADELYFIRGRLKFGGSKNSAPFPSMVVIYKGGE